MLAAAEPSPLSEFLQQLFETGRVRVPELPIAEADFATADAVLTACQLQFRRDLAGEPPPFDLAAARWAAVAFYRACQLVAHRHLGEPSMRAAFAAPNLDQRSAAVHYSIDLTFRYLPDLERLARSSSQNDPHLEHLRSWARQWPLSSVGMRDIEPADASPVLDNACLLSLYVDRALEHRDLPRLADARAREAARRALGLFVNLAPEVAQTLGIDPSLELPV
jgi:hypothetical protein